MSNQAQAAAGRGRDQRFPRTARLLSSTQFQRVFAHQTRFSDRYFVIAACPRLDDSAARLGLAVARKQARRAVDRNRLKRLIRESFRTHRHDLCGLDIVVLCRREAPAAGNAALRRSLATHWRRLRERLCESSST